MCATKLKRQFCGRQGRIPLFLFYNEKFFALKRKNENKQTETERRKKVYTFSPSLSLSSTTKNRIFALILQRKTKRSGARSEAEGRRRGNKHLSLSFSSYNKKRIFALSSTTKNGTCVRRPKFEHNKSKNIFANFGNFFFFFFSLPCWYLCKIHLQLCA